MYFLFLFFFYLPHLPSSLLVKSVLKENSNDESLVGIKCLKFKVLCTSQQLSIRRQPGGEEAARRRKSLEDKKARRERNRSEGRIRMISERGTRFRWQKGLLWEQCRKSKEGRKPKRFRNQDWERSE